MLHRAWAYLSVIFAIFARDVKRVLRNPVALVVVLGMAVMPSAYAWYVIAANWDPYSNTSGMKVAVANSDAGFDSSVAGRLDVGDQVVQQLQGNHELGWEFVGADQAVNGVYEGEYWAAVVIPEDFSEDFASVFTGDFTRPTLDYYVNEKPSSIAPKVTDTGVDALQKAIDENFVKLVAERVVDTTQEAGEQAEGKGEAAQSNLTEGIVNARETVGQAREAIGNLQVTIDSTKESAASADDTLARLQEGLGPLGDAVAKAKSLLDEARATESEYGSSLATKATEGALVLGDVAAQAQREAASIEGAVQRAGDDAQAALQRAQGLLEANENLIAALEARAADPAIAADPQAAAAVAEALEQAKGANADLQTTVGALQQATDALGTTAAALETQAQAMDEAASAASESVRQTAADFQANVLPAMTGSLDELADACGTLQGALAGLSPTLSQARSVLGELETMLTSASSSLSTTSDALGTMESNLDRNLSDLQALQQSSTVRMLSEYLEADPADVGAFMASPVTLETKLVYPVRNYGSGVAPFFTNLALWVAGFILMAIVRMRVDPAGLPRFTAAQAYFAVHRRPGLFRALAVLRGHRACAGACLLRGRLGYRHPVRKPRSVHRRRASDGVRGREPHVRLGLCVSPHRQGSGGDSADHADTGLVGDVPHRDDAGVLPGYPSVAALHVLHRRHARGYRRFLRAGLPARHADAWAGVRAGGAGYWAGHWARGFQPEPDVRREAGQNRPVRRRAGARLRDRDGR